MCFGNRDIAKSSLAPGVTTLTKYQVKTPGIIETLKGWIQQEVDDVFVLKLSGLTVSIKNYK